VNVFFGTKYVVFLGTSRGVGFEVSYCSQSREYSPLSVSSRRRA